MKKIAIANDHGGVELKNYLIKKYKKVYEFINLGTDSYDSVDYPTYAIKVAEMVKDKKADYGILICKSGEGMCIAANKVKGIRCGLAYNLEVASLCHKHNKANVLAMGASYVSKQLAGKMLVAFVEENFEERHQRRVDIISNYESNKK